MCDKCKTKFDKYIYHADEIIDGVDDLIRDIDLIEATDRVFVSDLPWWERFLIWVFPFMFKLEDYNGR